MAGLVPPGAVTNLAITGASGGIVADLTPEATWDAVAGALTYTLQYSTASDFTGATEVTGIATNSYTHTSALNHNTTYYWRVAAVGPGGQGPWSDSVNVLVYDFIGALLALPGLLALWYAGDGTSIPAELNGATDGGAVTTWDDLSANGYDVTQAGADTLKPTCDQSNAVFNNRGCVTFDGGDYLTRSKSVGQLTDRLALYNIFVVFSTTHTGTNYPEFYTEGNASSGANYVAVGVGNMVTDAKRIYGAHRGTAFINMEGAGAVAVNNGLAHIHTFRRIAAQSSEIRLDGVQAAVDITNNAAADCTNVTIGALIRTTVSNYMIGSIACVAVFAADNYAIVEPILSEHYGIG